MVYFREFVLRSIRFLARKIVRACDRLDLLKKPSSQSDIQNLWVPVAELLPVLLDRTERRLLPDFDTQLPDARGEKAQTAPNLSESAR